MILTDQQRDALITKILEYIRNDKICGGDYRKDYDLFDICEKEYRDQYAAYKGEHPLYVEDERGTFGFMRLRDDDGRILGYDTKENKEYTDINYNPSPADKRKIAEIIESGTPVFYYIRYYLAVSLGVILDEYTEPAVYEYERKRHRRFDLTDPNPNNSALYIALYLSYIEHKNHFLKKYLDAKIWKPFYCYDFPTLTSGTKTRKDYYARLIQRATKGEITLKQIWHFPNGKGLDPIKNKGLQFDYGGLLGETVSGYNCDTILHGRDYMPHDESEIDDDLVRIPDGLFWGATR